MTEWTNTSLSAQYTILGVDPGLSGGIAVIAEDKIVGCTPMPTVPIKVGKAIRTKYDLEDLRNRFEAMKLEATRRNLKIRVFVEKQQVMPADARGTIAAFMSGLNYGTICGILYGLHIAYRGVPAATWKRAMMLAPSTDYGTRKLAAVDMCKKLFPGVNLKRTDKCSKDHDGMAEALLLAEYGRRFLTRED